MKTSTKILLIVCVLLLLVGISPVIMAKNDTGVGELKIVDTPIGVNLGGFEGNFSSRDGKCIQYSFAYWLNNTDWGLISANNENPYSGVRFSHMFLINGDGTIVFEPVSGNFYDRGGFNKVYKVKDETIYYWFTDDPRYG